MVTNVQLQTRFLRYRYENGTGFIIRWTYGNRKLALFSGDYVSPRAARRAGLEIARRFLSKEIYERLLAAESEADGG